MGWTCHDFPTGSAPLKRTTRLIEAGVDALLAGDISSDGHVSREGLAKFEAILSYQAQSPALQEILARLAVMLGLSHEP